MSKIPIILESEYLSIISQNQHHIDNLLNIINSYEETLIRNCFYTDNTTDINKDLFYKQRNLFSIAKAGGNNILEIGFNAGHSCLLFLIANPHCHIHVFDNCEFLYMKPCFQYLIDNFGERMTLYTDSSIYSISLFKGNIKKTFDIFHIDGSSENNISNIDFYLCLDMARDKSILIWGHFHSQLFDGYIADRHILEFELLHTPIYSHRLAYFIKNPLKIAVCSMTVGEEYKEITKYPRKTKLLYCEKHGYDFFDSDDFFDNSRAPAWSKINILLYYLNLYTDLFPTYDYIWWIDGDTFIMNDETKLEDFINSSLTLGKDITMAQDWKLPNTGVLIIKNTEWTRNFLRASYDQTQFLTHANWEQAAILDMHEKNISDSQNHINILPVIYQNTINSYWYSYDYNSCFILHFPGCYRNKENFGLREQIKLFCPLKTDEDTDESFEQRKHWYMNTDFRNHKP